MASQADVRYSLKVNGETQFEVVKFTHTERLGELFETTLALVSFDEAPVFKDILDQAATLTLWQGDEEVRYINGIVTEFSQGKTGFRRSHYEMKLAPALSRLQLVTDSRHFQNKKVPDIVSQLLNENGINHFDFTTLKRQKPEIREFCQIYRENLFEAICRLTREEGYYFYFEHQADQHILHFVDDTQSAPRLGDLLYNGTGAGDQSEPCVHQINYQEKIASTAQVMRDYNFTNPDYQLQHKSELKQNEANKYEQYDFPGRYKFDEAGQPFTQTRLEELRRDTVTIDAQGDDMRAIAGYRMNLTNHPRKEWNDEWVMVEVVHEGYQPGVLAEEATGMGEPDSSTNQEGSYYKNTIHMVPWTVKWRASTMARPVVDGPQMAMVVGPQGEEIYCDEWGRVKIQFSYDRYSKFDENSSCWVRVAQGWAGMGFGGIAIPRIGQEVIVDYLEGDPDQPVVTGRTFNANNLPPYPLPANKTRMTIKSSTHKGAGFNELRFEDENAKQEVFIHAEKDQNNVVKNNETTNVGVDRSENIGQNETIGIGKDRSENVGNDETIAVGHDRTENVGNDETVSIGKNQKNTIGKNRTKVVGKNENTTIGGNQIELIKKNKAETIAIAKALTIGAAYQVSVGAAKNETVGLSSSEQVGIMKHIVVGKRFELVVGKSSLVLNSDGTIILSGEEILIESGKKTLINGKLVKIN